MLLHRKRVQDVAGRGDRVATVHELLVRQVSGRDHADGGGFVARDLAVLAGGEPGLGDLVLLVKQLCGLAEVIAGLEGQRVGRGDLRLLAEFLADVLQRRLQRPPVQPVHQTQRVHVLAPVGVLGAEPRLLGRRRVHFVDRDLDDAILARQAAVFDRVGLVARFLEVLGREGVLVDDDDPAIPYRLDVGPQRGRVHRDQRVHLVARGENVGAGKVDLVARDAGQRAGGGADFGGEVGQRADVVADQGRGVGELCPGQLHPVAGVPGESDGHRGKGMNRLVLLPIGSRPGGGATRCGWILMRARQTISC